MKDIRMTYGALVGCRPTGPRKFEVTMANARGKARLLDGFEIGDTAVLAKPLANDELVVCFLILPTYITDKDILDKLHGWGVTAVSTIRRRMWPGTHIADGTRFVKVKFTDTVQSLPSSARLPTALGPESFRVDRQARVCRQCLQKDHVLKDCEEFKCFKCQEQGHYARDCPQKTQRKVQRKCAVCYDTMATCICNHSDGTPSEDSQAEEEGGASGVSLEWAYEEVGGNDETEVMVWDGVQHCQDLKQPGGKGAPGLGGPSLLGSSLDNISLDILAYYIMSMTKRRVKRRVKQRAYRTPSRLQLNL